MKNSKLNYIIPFLFLFSIGLIVFSSLSFQVDNVKIDNEQINNFNDGWICLDKDDESFNILLPQKLQSKKQEIITITNRIPEKWDGLTLAFRTSDQLLKVYFEGVEAYTFGYHDVRAFGKTPGSAWHFIDIPYDLNDGEIKIELSSPYKNYGGVLPTIYVGVKSACVFQLFKSNLIGFIISLITLLFGILLIIFYLLVKKLKTTTKSLLYLGEFSIIMSLACMIETRLLQLFFGNQSVLSISIFLLHMLAPIPFILYLGEVYFVTMQHKFQIIANVFIANFVIIVSLQVMNIFDFMQMNWLNHVLLLLAGIYIIITIIKLIITNKWNSSLTYFCVALSVLLLCILLDVIGFYEHVGDVTLFQRLGLFSFILALSILDIRKSLALMSQGMEAETLRLIAYEDILTKCKNRIYFEENFSKIEENIHLKTNVGVAIFDINNLKKINDHRGHCEGDSMLIHAAKLIGEYFSEYAQISRIGGDEFAFVVSDVPLIKIEEDFLRFNQAMKEHKNNIDVDYDIAYGYAYYNPEIDKDLQATFIRADSKMYTCKKEMKSVYEIAT